jgi:pyochelin synthetase
LGQRKAEILDLLRQARAIFPLPQVRPDPAHRHHPFPLTDIQQACWIGREGAFALSVPTHDYTEIEAEGIDTARLGQAWQRLIERHKMLRAVILPSGEQQILAHTPLYELKVYDMTGADADTIAAHVEAIRQNMWQRRSPPDQWPLFDIRFTRIADQRTLIHISLNMLLVDWHSYKILFHEWYQLYHHSDHALPPLHLSF